MRIVIVYLGNLTLNNFAHSKGTGVWGFKVGKQPNESFRAGDMVVFASGYTGGNIRLQPNLWLPHSVTMVATAQITSELFTEDTYLWPDEIAKGRVKYPKRFRFTNLRWKDGRFPLSDESYFPLSVSLAIRQAAIGGKGQVVQIEKLPQWLLSEQEVSPVSDTRATTTQTLPNDAVTIPTELSVPNTLFEVANFIASRGFVFPERLVANLYASLRAKPFVILAGNSGTGKSRLARLFAEAIGANVGNGRFQMVPVRPDWNDSSDLLGYFDLNGDFRPGHLISTILRAHAQQDRPFFVCLDEMNLARVEHYFSDFLSIIESRRRESGAVVTDPVLREEHIRRMKRESLSSDVVRIVEDLQKAEVPIGFPPNLFVVGTVNMDETTQPFSRKVLDRANTLEFNEIDLEEGLTDAGPETPVPPLDLRSGFLSGDFTNLNDVPTEHRDTAGKVASFLQSLNASLALAGFEVGYRVRDEAIAFTVYALGAGMSQEEAEENIVLQKVLPRVQGSAPRIETALISLMKRLAGDEEVPDKEATDFTMRLEQLRVSPDASPVLRKLAGMLLIFREEGFTSFWLA